ncbi:hypothetical protein ACFO0A_12760 [Novosphingobium tardum]|uniref:Transferrin-binding protein B C-lobe/N-lobe beta barrel domain-containing protein n=1 Tax=Novosphingobium tardum TaxID=1538021 RepID=A0ABV8RRZ5_9SPHN
MSAPYPEPIAAPGASGSTPTASVGPLLPAKSAAASPNLLGSTADWSVLNQPGQLFLTYSSGFANYSFGAVPDRFSAVYAKASDSYRVTASYYRANHDVTPYQTFDLTFGQGDLAASETNARFTTYRKNANGIASRLLLLKPTNDLVSTAYCSIGMWDATLNSGAANQSSFTEAFVYGYQQSGEPPAGTRTFNGIAVGQVAGYENRQMMVIGRVTLTVSYDATAQAYRVDGPVNLTGVDAKTHEVIALAPIRLQNNGNADIILANTAGFADFGQGRSKFCGPSFDEYSGVVFSRVSFGNGITAGVNLAIIATPSP